MGQYLIVKQTNMAEIDYITICDHNKFFNPDTRLCESCQSQRKGQGLQNQKCNLCYEMYW